jgi:hypothetical protein
MHLSQLIDAASASVTEVNVSLQQAKMDIASSSDFTSVKKQFQAHQPALPSTKTNSFKASQVAGFTHAY